MNTINNTTQKPRKIEIVGLITSVAYQNARLCAKNLYKHHPKLFSNPKFVGMLEFDWDEHITKQRRKFGGAYWTLLRPVAVYIDGQFVGSDKEFVDMVNFKFCCRFTFTADNNYYQNEISCDYSRYVIKSKRCYVYFEIWIHKTRIGNLVFQLYSDLLPETCNNFRCLCTGEKGTTDEGVTLSYKNTEIFRICTMGWIQGGDIENISGGGGRSVYDATFADEGYCISHDRRGVLSMANDGKHSNGSQFFVTLQPTLWMDYYYVAFGQLVEGVEVLKAVENVATYYEKPTEQIRIEKCGVVYAPQTVEEKEEKARLASESILQEMHEVEVRRIATLNKCTICSTTSIDQVVRYTTVVDELDSRDVASELDVRKFLDGEYYVMDIPIKTEDIIRPILYDLADGVIREEDLIVYTSNELLARSIIIECIAKGIVSYDDYDSEKVTASEVSMIKHYLFDIIANMSTTSTRQQREYMGEEDKSDYAIKEYLEGVVTNIMGSSRELHHHNHVHVTYDEILASHTQVENFSRSNNSLEGSQAGILSGLKEVIDEDLLSTHGNVEAIDIEGTETAAKETDVDGIAEMYGTPVLDDNVENFAEDAE